MNPEAWLASAVGQRCLDSEQSIVSDVLDRVFGEQLLQIGGWGRRDTFLRYARTQRCALIDDCGWRTGPDVVSACGQLAVASDSIDAVLLPHTLERSASAHALLREAARVLRGDGQLVILGFSPRGLWGLRQLLDPRGYPPGSQRLIGEGKLRDWLELLSFEVGPARAYLHALPFERFTRAASIPPEPWASRWLPFAAAGYLLVAQKRVVRLTPVRPSWGRPRLRAVRGLVEPTTRASRTSQGG